MKVLKCEKSELKILSAWLCFWPKRRSEMAIPENPAWIEVLLYNVVLCLVGLCVVFLLYRRAHQLRSTQLYRCATVHKPAAVRRTSSKEVSNVCCDRLVDANVFRRGQIRLPDEEGAVDGSNDDDPSSGRQQSNHGHSQWTQLFTGSGSSHRGPAQDRQPLDPESQVH